MSNRNPATLGVWGPSGTRVVASEDMWKQPLKWNKVAAEIGERRRVFCASLADVFEDWQGKMDESHGRQLWYDGQSWTHIPGGRTLDMNHVRARLFRLIDATPNLDWLLLTKRPENVMRMLPKVGFPEAGVPGTLGRYLYYDNVQIGASIENQETADKRMPILLSIPAAVRFVSYEPALGPVKLFDKGCPYPIHTPIGARVGNGLLDWVIIGGESGHGARPAHINWFRSMVEQCADSGTRCFVKQLGRHYYQQDTPAAEKSHCLSPDQKGGNMDHWPSDLKVRQFPTPKGPQDAIG